MKKILAAFFVLLMLAVPVTAQSTASYRIGAYLLLGKGIASSPDDSMDFLIVKIGIAKLVADNETEYGAGIIKVDEEKFRLGDIETEEGYIEGDIFENGTDIGYFDLTSVMKGDTEVWAGEMIFRGTRYNLHVIQGTRPIKAGELKDKVASYCSNSTDSNCREKIQDYCKNNPDDSRCRALFRAYCLRNNMDDMRCRQAFAEWCEDNPENKYCVPFALQRTRKYCEMHSSSRICRAIASDAADFCEENPDNEGCLEIQQLIEDYPRLFRKISSLRNKILEIDTRAGLSTSDVTSADVEGD
ncbi:MAG: hypothetical protein JSV92_01460 [archaeon]|nr:MAG: hypothetical protein JSV92_01460 [archaeon]